MCPLKVLVVHLHGKPMLIRGIIKKEYLNVQYWWQHERWAGLVQSEVRHIGIQQINVPGASLQQNMLICAAKYADFWPHFVS